MQLTSSGWTETTCSARSHCLPALFIEMDESLYQVDASVAGSVGGHCVPAVGWP